MFERCGYRIDACQTTPMKLTGTEPTLDSVHANRRNTVSGLNIGAKQP